MFESSGDESSRADLINSCRCIVESQKKANLSIEDIQLIFENSQFIGYFHQLFEDQHLSSWLESLRENLG